MPAAAGCTGETAAGCTGVSGGIMSEELGGFLNDVETVVEEIEAAPAPVETAEVTDTGEVTAPPAVVEEDPREKGFQAALMDERRKRQAVERERDELRNQHQAKPEPVQQAVPNPEEFAGGEYDPAYISALSRYEVRQEHNRIRQEEAEAAQKLTLDQKYSTVEQAGLQKYPDYNVAIESLVSSGVRFSEVAMEVIAESEYGHDISYLLATNPQAAFNLSKLSPAVQARELGKLEMRMQMQNQQPAKPEIPIPQPKPEVPQTLTQQRDTRGQFKAADSGPPSLESILS